MQPGLIICSPFCCYIFFIITVLSSSCTLILSNDGQITVLNVWCKLLSASITDMDTRGVRFFCQILVWASWCFYLTRCWQHQWTEKNLYFISIWSRINSLMTLVQPIRRQVDKYTHRYIDESGEYSATLISKNNIEIRLCLKIQQPSIT